MAAAPPSAEAVGTHEAASSVGSSSTDSALNFVSGELQTISLVTRADTIQQEILDLAAIRNDLNQQKKHATKAFRNLEKTRKRLKKKSAALSTKDLARRLQALSEPQREIVEALLLEFEKISQE